MTGHLSRMGPPEARRPPAAAAALRPGLCPKGIQEGAKAVVGLFDLTPVERIERLLDGLLDLAYSRTPARARERLRKACRRFNRSGNHPRIIDI